MLITMLLAAQIAVIAHRGEHLHAPENSLAAIEGAIAVAADYVELDVRTTSDGRLILMHDGTVGRTTNGQGQVAKLSFEEISQLELKPVGYIPSKPARIPTFEDALRVAHGRIHVYVDCKSLTPVALIEALRQVDMSDSVVVYGDKPFLAEVHRLAPNLRVMPEADDAATVSKVAGLLGLTVLAFDAADFNDMTIQAARSRQLDIFVDRMDASDSEPYWAEAIELGATGIQTNHPAELAIYLSQRGLHSAPAQAH